MKKRALSLLLVLMMAVTLVPTMALAENNVVAYEVTGGNIYFNKSTGGITGCDLGVTEANIPSEIDGAAVTSITDSAFAFCSSLMSITIPKSLTYISERALEIFQYVSSCSLNSITVEEGNPSYSSDSGVLFNNDKTALLLYPRCKTNTSYEIPDNVVTVSKYAFKGCKNLESIVVPKSVINIGVETWVEQFSECSKLESITVEELNPVYSSVGGVLFNKNKTVLIEYPSGKAGEAYTIPDSVTDIGHAFAGNAQLKRITIPESITGLDLGAFTDCTSLESINIPESVTRIGGSARENEDCQTTPQCVFSGCSSLKNINVAEENPAYVSVDGVLFNKNKTTLLIYPTGKTDMSYVIPDSVTYIEDYAFSGCAGLTSVTIPSGVTCIEGDTFSGCTGLTSVTIPAGVTSIGSSAFSGCTSLKRIEIPNSVTSIGGCAFNGCASLTSITMPNGVTSIAHETFGGCTGLVSITIPNSVTSIYEFAFSGCTSLTDVYYTGTEEQWNAINVWDVNDYLLNATIHYNYHEHVTETVNARAAACTEAGYTGDEVCTVCGELISQGETIEATGHHFKGNTCTDCGATRSTTDTIRAFFQDSFNSFKSFFDKLFGR